MDNLSRRLAIDRARRFLAVEKQLAEKTKKRSGFHKESMHTGAEECSQGADYSGVPRDSAAV